MKTHAYQINATAPVILDTHTYDIR
jgi:hypothetical protein